MTQPSYKEIILKYLKAMRDAGVDGGWVLEGVIRSKQTEFGWIGFRGDRDVRDLITGGFLEDSKRGGKLQWVRYKDDRPELPREKKARELREKEDATLAGLRAGRPLLQ